MSKSKHSKLLNYYQKHIPTATMDLADTPTGLHRTGHVIPALPKGGGEGAGGESGGGSEGGGNVGGGAEGDPAHYYSN